MNPGFGDVPLLFQVFFVFVTLAFVAIVVLAITTALRSRKVLRDSGLDPLAAQAQLAVRFAQGPLGTPSQSLEQRLAELDDLHRRGVITNAEHDAARRSALEGQA